MKLTFRNVIHKCSALIVFAWLFVAGIAAADEPLATIEGNLSPELSELLAATLGEAENPPRSLAQARRRVERAAKSAEDVMRSQGYYGAAIEGTIVETIEDDTAIAPPKPVLTIVPGPRFKFSNFFVKYANDVLDVSDLAAKEIELSEDEPALAARIVAADDIWRKTYTFRCSPAVARGRPARQLNGSCARTCLFSHAFAPIATKVFHSSGNAPFRLS